MRACYRMSLLLGCLLLLNAPQALPPLAAAEENGSAKERPLRALLDAPLLFTKRHSYQGIHIYDTFFKWIPGGGIYVLENPADPPELHRVRAIIDPTTPETLGEGIYSDVDLSWDAKRLLFCFKGEQLGSTSIYEIGIDGKGLRRVSDPRPSCATYRGSYGGVHDVTPAYLPDGRIAFTSTRPQGLVPCANEGVNILHVMNADGCDLHPISVNNVNEFDPCVLPDGRLLFGRWEYIDKTALTQQSLWTVFPEGTNETALYANNMVHPEALLDARPVPGDEHLIAATLTPHNSPPRGSLAIIDTRLGKNDPAAITNFEHPDNPTFDRGESCDPWPLSRDVLVFSGRPQGSQYNVLEMIGRDGRREVLHTEAGICCHEPMLVKPRPRPEVTFPTTRPGETTGRFFVQNIYDGLTGVNPGEVKQLRVIEETSRISATPGGAMNQVFLMSGVLAWSAKNYLGVVPVADDGSAYFEVPSERAVYLQALDADGRLVQSMRTFVQAAPGTTRSCIGCHENKFSAPPGGRSYPPVNRQADRLKPESWGSGFIDYPSMVQPVLDKHCVQCHGGQQGFGGKLDLTGGWTEFFSIGYENLISRRERQLTASLIAGVDTMNGTSRWSAQIFPPRKHGSGAAPLAEVLVSGHKGRLHGLSRTERDLLMAWIDTNGLYHGTWDYTANGCSVKSWQATKQALIGEMQSAGCLSCHQSGDKVQFEDDWFNLQHPELSRLLRAPLATGGSGLGLALCRKQRPAVNYERVRILVGGQYLHGDLPVDQFKAQVAPAAGEPAEPNVTFTDTSDPHYQTLLQLIRDGRRRALSEPRADMPGAEIIPGKHREFLPPPLPDPLPTLQAQVDADSLVHLSWERSARTIGLEAEVYRGAEAGFEPSEETRLAATPLFAYADAQAQPGNQHYAVLLVSNGQRSHPMRADLSVPPPQPPDTPTGLQAKSAPGRVELAWNEVGGLFTRYHVYRSAAGAGEPERLTAEPVAELHYSDVGAAEGTDYTYTVRAANRRGTESAPSPPVVAAPLPEIKDPMFVASFAENLDAAAYPTGAAPGTPQGTARVVDGTLDLSEGGFVTFAHRPAFDLTQRLSIECWVNIEKGTDMPVVLSCGVWRQAGWFLQRIGAGWRWHVGGIDCDGGKPAPGKWTHLVGTYDGQAARLYQDGELVAEKPGTAITALWNGPLHVGQYSGGPGPQYQVLGRMAGVRVYGRALSLDDVRAAHDATARLQQ